MDEARFSIFESEIGTQIRLIKETYRKIEERKADIMLNYYGGCLFLSGG